MKSSEEIMEVLEAFDLVENCERAAELAGVDPKTVKRYVELRAMGFGPDAPGRRDRLADFYADKIEEWMERSKGKVAADVVHRKLVAMSYQGSERTTRRAVAEAREAYLKGHRRIYRPWIPEPGMWFQWDWSDGPKLDERETSLWCAWLAWSRFRVVIPTWDRTLPTVIACIDETLRAFGGAPTYSLTDNERTVTIDRVARIAVRHPEMVKCGRHYGMQIRTCHTGDPESKGGVEATVRIAQADLVPTDVNLRDQYSSFAELLAACKDFTERVNTRPHRETRRPPAEMLLEERQSLHPIPTEPYAAAFGQTRLVEDDCTIRFGSCRYSVPHEFIGDRVWVRVAGEEIVCVHVSKQGAREVARHFLTTPGNPRIVDAHYPERSEDPLNPRPRSQSPFEKEFLEIGHGAEAWLIEAAANGAQRVRSKMQRAIELKSLLGEELVDRALGRAAQAHRFSDEDLESIIERLKIEDVTNKAVAVVGAAIADDGASLQNGTRSWKGLGR